MVNNLGLLYANQGKLVEAQQMYQRALQGYEKALGPEHMSTLTTVSNLGLVFKKQCYAAAKLSGRNIVLAYIKQLAGLCLRFPHSRLTLFDCVGRAFLWVGDNRKSAAVFAHQLALSSPEYNADCDGCDTRLCVDTSRFVCTVCEDRDLCKSCFDKLESNDRGEVPSSRQGHTFLELDGISIVRSFSTDNANNSVLIEQWLKHIADL
jgi:tetratricopeptide (TPR) repeat protein